MSCVALEQLAAAAAGEDDAALDHARACPRCAALIAEQQAMRSLARSLRPPAFDADRRTLLAAEVMARADALPRRHTRLVLGIGAALATAAAVALIVRSASTPDSDPLVVIAPEAPPLQLPARAVGFEPRPPGFDDDPRAMVEATPDADLTRDTSPDRDEVALRSGTVFVDTSRTRDIQVLAGATRIEVAQARAKITARRGTIEAVRVFAGSVEIIDGGKRHVIVAGATWQRLAKPAGTTPTVAMEAFREGWIALRAGDHAAAIAAFDRATDPVAVEDATYWAAVASERAGMRDEARRRYADFVARFAASPRIAAARSALERLE